MSELSRPSLLAEALYAQLAEAMLTIISAYLTKDHWRLPLTYVLSGSAREEVREEVLDLVHEKGQALETLWGAAMRSS